jgi:hypothetical protein
MLEIEPHFGRSRDPLQANNTSVPEFAWVLGKVTLYFLALLAQALIERELLRVAMKREKIAQLPLYPEQRLCAKPTTEQILGPFSFAQRHELIQDGNTVQVFYVQFTDLQRQLLTLLRIPEQAFRPQ